MNWKKPKRVEINGRWYNVSDGWAGALDMSEFMSPISYTAKAPYVHLMNLYFVYDSNGNKIGEFDVEHRSHSGCVTGLEM